MALSSNCGRNIVNLFAFGWVMSASLYGEWFHCKKGTSIMIPGEVPHRPEMENGLRETCAHGYF